MYTIRSKGKVQNIGKDTRKQSQSINYDRILELRYRKNLKGRNWSDPGEYEYQQCGRRS